MEVKIFVETSWASPGKTCGVGMWIVEAGPKRVQRRGFVRISEATAQQAQLRTLTAALDILIRPCEIRIITSDPMLGDLTSGRVERWKEAGWTGSAGSPVKNRGEWESVLAGMETHRLLGVEGGDHEKKTAMMLQICDELKKWKNEVVHTTFYVGKEEA